MLFHTVEKVDTFGIWQQVKEMIYSFLNPSIRVRAKSESLENAILLEKEINTGNEKCLGPGIIRVSRRLLLLSMYISTCVYYLLCLSRAETSRSALHWASLAKMQAKDAPFGAEWGGNTSTKFYPLLLSHSSVLIWASK